MPAGGAPFLDVTRPALSQRYHVEVIPGEAVAFVAENASFVLADPALQQVVPLVDGRRSTAEIVQALAGRLPADTVVATVRGLAGQGFVHEADGELPAVFAAFWAELGIPPTRLPALLASVRVDVQALTSWPHPGLAGAVASFGLPVTAAHPTVRLVAVDDYLDSRLAAVNARALADGIPWLLLKPDGVNVWIGPMLVPGRTACWECLRTRLRQNRPVDAYLHKRTGRTDPLPSSRARVWTTSAQAYGMATTQLLRWLATGHLPELETTITIVETVPIQLSRHPVLRRPQCPVCGDPRLAVPPPHPPRRDAARRPIRSTDGGERVELPAETFARFAHHISPVSGVVSGVYPSPWQTGTPLRTYTAGHNFALSNDSLLMVANSLRAYSSGKGRTDEQARASALCEALERYSGVYQGDEPRRLASLAELGELGIHPNACMLYSDRQYAERDAWNARGSRFQVVPNPFDANRRIEWSPVYSVTEQRTKYLPTSYLYFGYPQSPADFTAWGDSNGNAAGATLDDACLQGCYELVERDAVALWWYNQVRRPRVDLAGLADPYLADLDAFYQERGREFWVLDLTTDLGIPVFAAVTRRVGAPTEDIVLGFGAHADPAIGVLRAVTEMNQFLPAVLDVGPDGTTRYGIDDRDAVAWWSSATTLTDPYLVPLSAQHDTRVAPGSLPDGAARPDAGERVDAFVDRVQQLGLEVLLLDQTRPDIGLPVVKVIVPGLRHFWARFAPGRLYDAPVQLGWIAEPTPEDRLNPTAMFL